MLFPIFDLLYSEYFEGLNVCMQQCELIPFSYNLIPTVNIHPSGGGCACFCLERQTKVMHNHNSSRALWWHAISSAVESPWGGEGECLFARSSKICCFWLIQVWKTEHSQSWWAEVSALGKTNVVLYCCACKGCILSQHPAVCSLGSLIKQHHHPRSACATWADKNT